MSDLPHPSNAVSRRSDIVSSFPSPIDIKLPILSPPAKIVRAGNVTSTVAPSSCNIDMNPKCIQQLYGIPRTSAPQPSNKLAVSGYIKEFANKVDLSVCAKASNSVPKTKLVTFQEFLSQFTNVSPNTTFTLQTIDGGTNSQDPLQAGIEAVSTATFHQHQIMKTDVVLKRILTYNTRSVLPRACRLPSSPLAINSKTAILRDF